VPFDRHRPIKDEPGQALHSLFPERLPLLGGVDAREPHPVLLLGLIQGRDGVAIGDPDDPARYNVRRGRRCDQQGQPDETID